MKDFKKFVAQKLDIFALIGLVAVFSVLLFWQVGKGSLQSWDEAWYATISRNVLVGSNPLVLTYNQKPFFDHPPLGFYLKASSMLVFGQTTLAVRLPELLFALLSIVVLFRIGKRSSSSWAGIWAATILASSRWFIFRARSGNLDVMLLATQLLVLWGMVEVVLLAKKPAAKTSLYNHRWLLLTWFFFCLSLLTKSLISLQLLPLLGLLTVYYFYAQRESMTAFFRVKLVAVLSAIIALLLGPWYLVNTVTFPYIFLHQQLRIGFRSGTEKSLSVTNIMTMIRYFQAAIHRWFKYVIIGSSLFPLVVYFSRSKIMIFVVFSYTFLVSFPYFISNKTEIWHLVPSVGAVALFASVMVDQALQLLQRIKLKQMNNVQKTARIVLTCAVLALAGVSWRDYWKEFINVTIHPLDYQKITTHISHRDSTLYATSDANFAGLVYYANLDGAAVEYLSDDGLVAVCDALDVKGKSFQAVARFGDWLMNVAGDEHVIAREGELVLIEMPASNCGSGEALATVDNATELR